MVKNVCIPVDSICHRWDFHWRAGEEDKFYIRNSFYQIYKTQTQQHCTSSKHQVCAGNFKCVKGKKADSLQMEKAAAKTKTNI